MDNTNNNNDKNALAELAERIGGIRTPPTFYLKMDDYHRANDDLAKARRIIAELRELLIELANAANTAFDDIAKCGSIIADGDVRDAAYRTHLMERIAKYRKALKGVNDES